MIYIVDRDPCSWTVLENLESFDLLKMIVLGDLSFRWGFENLLELLLWSFILWSSCYYFTLGLVFYGTWILDNMWTLDIVT
jgi:hypothetical protein